MAKGRGVAKYNHCYYDNLTQPKCKKTISDGAQESSQIEFQQAIVT